MPKREKPEFQTNDNGIPIWMTSDGVILGLSKEDFLNDTSKANPEVAQESRKQFYLYMAMYKGYRAEVKREQANQLEADSKSYTEKAENVGKVLSPEDKIKAKAREAKAKFEKLRADLIESGMSEQEVNDFLAG